MLILEMMKLGDPLQVEENIKFGIASGTISLPEKVDRIERYYMSVDRGAGPGSIPPERSVPPLGIWFSSSNDKGIYYEVSMNSCGEFTCGTISGVFGPDETIVENDIVGKRFVWELMSDGQGVWTGKVYNPNQDKTYQARLVHSGNEMTLSGCVMGICRTAEVYSRLAPRSTEDP